MPRDQIPFLPGKQIEEAAELLLGEYAHAQGWQISAPVPIEEIVEVFLKLIFEFEDLQKSLGLPDVMAAIWFDSKTIRVDVRLDPTNKPQRLGRYRFTLGHEAGHWRLHRQHYVEDPNQEKLFDGRGQPAFICRSSQKPPAEWQADFFSACLLMPRDVVRREWQDWRGNLDAVALQQLPAMSVSNDPKENAEATLERFCRPFAERFEVSAEAM
jgi:hypothetical protein